MQTHDEEMIAVGMALVTLFAILNVDPLVGTFYALGVMTYLVPLLTKRKDWFVEFFTKGQNISKSLFIAGLVFLGWLVLSSVVFSYYLPTQQFALLDFKVFHVLAAYTTIPVLSKDPIIVNFIWDLAIPIIECMILLSFALWFYMKLFKLREVKWYPLSTPQGKAMLWVCLLIGVTGSAYHATARQLSDIALIIDVIFFTMSALLVFRQKRLAEASFFHIFVNAGYFLSGATR